MSKESIEFSFTPAKTLEFLREVIVDPQKPIPRVAEKHGEEMKSGNKAGSLKLNLMAAYLLTPATLEEIGNLYGGITRERVRQIVETSVKDLWEASSGKTKTKFPWDKIPLGKDRERLHRKTIDIAKKLQQGHVPEDVSSERKYRLRQALKIFGIEVPRKTRDLRELVTALENAKDDKEISELLGKVNNSFYRRLLKKDEKVIITIKEVVQGLGYRYFPQNAPAFVDSLEKANVPVASFSKGEGHRYHFIAAQHLGTARRVLRSNANLKEYRKPPWERVCGPKVAKKPTTSELVEKRGYQKVGDLLKELGVDLGGRRRYSTRDFLGKDCPVTVFKLSASYYFPLEDKDLLTTYFQRRIREISSGKA